MQDAHAPQVDSLLVEVTAMLGVAVTSHGSDLLTLSGRLQAGCLADVRPPFLRVVSSGSGDVHVDLSRAELGDAAAVGLFVEAHHLALRRGRRLVVDEATARSERLLRAVRVLPRGWRPASASVGAVAALQGALEELAETSGVAALTA